MEYSEERGSRGGRYSFVTLLEKRLSDDAFRESMIFFLTSLINENDLYNAITKMCSLGEYTLLRFILVLIYNTDPLAFKPDRVVSCSIYDHDEFYELVLSTDSGLYCIGLSKSSPFVATSCSYEVPQVQKVSEKISIKLG